MHVLFTGAPAFGHLVPMLPLARAAREAGHEVAFATHAVMTGALAPFPVLPAGPDGLEMLVELARRTGVSDHGELVSRLTSEIGRLVDRSVAGSEDPDGEVNLNAEMFAGVRTDLGLDQALSAAASFRPDLVVAEEVDRVGALVAAARDVPWVSHGILLSGVVDGPITTGLERLTAARAAARSLTLSPRLAHLDPCPPSLALPGYAPGEDMVPVRPEPLVGEGAAPVADGDRSRPRVLVTMGTVVDDLPLLQALVAAVAALDVDVVVTVASPEQVEQVGDGGRVRATTFTPLSQLLEGVDAVVSAGGVGTVLGSLSRGIPLVVVPVLADQHVSARRLAAAGVGLHAPSPQDVGAAVRAVLDDRAFRVAAARIGEEIAVMDGAERVLDRLVEAVANHDASVVRS